MSALILDKLIIQNNHFTMENMHYSNSLISYIMISIILFFVYSGFYNRILYFNRDPNCLIYYKSISCFVLNFQILIIIAVLKSNLNILIQKIILEISSILSIPIIFSINYTNLCLAHNLYYTISSTQKSFKKRKQLYFNLIYPLMICLIIVTLFNLKSLNEDHLKDGNSFFFNFVYFEKPFLTIFFALMLLIKIQSMRYLYWTYNSYNSIDENENLKNIDYHSNQNLMRKIILNFLQRHGIIVASFIVTNFINNSMTLLNLLPNVEISSNIRILLIFITSSNLIISILVNLIDPCIRRYLKGLFHYYLLNEDITQIIYKNKLRFNEEENLSSKLLEDKDNTTLDSTKEILSINNTSNYESPKIRKTFPNKNCSNKIKSFKKTMNLDFQSLNENYLISTNTKSPSDNRNKTDITSMNNGNSFLVNKNSSSSNLNTKLSNLRDTLKDDFFVKSNEEESILKPKIYNNSNSSYKINFKPSYDIVHENNEILQSQNNKLKISLIGSKYPIKRRNSSLDNEYNYKLSDSKKLNFDNTDISKLSFKENEALNVGNNNNDNIKYMPEVLTDHEDQETNLIQKQNNKKYRHSNTIKISETRKNKFSDHNSHKYKEFGSLVPTSLKINYESIDNHHKFTNNLNNLDDSFYYEHLNDEYDLIEHHQIRNENLRKILSIYFIEEKSYNSVINKFGDNENIPLEINTTNCVEYQQLNISSEKLYNSLSESLIKKISEICSINTFKTSVSSYFNTIFLFIRILKSYSNNYSFRDIKATKKEIQKTLNELLISLNISDNLTNYLDIKFKGGRSGMSIYSTFDKMCLLKNVTNQESNTIKKFINSYYLRFLDNNTLLCPIYGLYKIKENIDNEYYTILMKNVNLYLKNLRKIFTFDLKGSSVDRQILNKKDQELIHKYLDKRNITYKNKINVSKLSLERIKALEKEVYLALNYYDGEVLKDEDLKSIGFKLMFSDEDSERFIDSIEKDCKLLKDYNITDYSILINVYDLHSYYVSSKDTNEMISRNQKIEEIKENFNYFISIDNQYLYEIAIIDYLSEYNYSKMGENLAKNLKLFLQGSKDNNVSAQNAERYCYRLISYAKSIL